MDQFIIKSRLNLEKLNNKTLIDLLIEKLSNDSEKPCLIDCTFDRKWTKKQVLDSSLNFGYYLINDCKLSKGDIVCFVTENSDIHAIGIIGVLVAGGVYVSLAEHSTEHEIKALIETIRPSILVCTGKNFHTMLNFTNDFEFIKKLLVIDERAKNQINIDKNLLTIEKILEQNGGQITLPEQRGADDCVTLVMSSGSTGQPKGIKRTNRNWLSLIASVAHKEVNPLTSEDVFMSSGFCHDCGQRSLFSCINSGAQLAIISMDEDQDDVFRNLYEYKVTTVFLVPTELSQLAKNYEKYDKNCLKYIRNVMTGGAGLSVQIYRTIVDKYGFERFRNGYGMSETGWSIGVYLSESKTLKNYQTIGKVIGGIEAKVIDEHEKSLPPNKHGQLCIRGDTVTPGYLNNDLENSKLFTQDGFLKTGDCAYYDDQEYFYIVGRIREFINVEAVVVSPAELERVLLQNENIENAAVIGIKDEEKGEIPLAFVKLVNGSTATAHEIQEFVDNRVNYYKKLRGGVRILNMFPVTSLRKINKPALRQMVA